MKKTAALVLIASAVFSSGCATKRYPMTGYMTPATAETLTCRELYVKLTEAEGARLKIAKTADVNGRSVAAFLGDLGITNAISRNDAERVVNQRLMAINAAYRDKGCIGGAVGPDVSNRDMTRFGAVIE
ncbi:hypothetical protein [Asticcacaulis endophyticus]|uniref:Lipoprotein n=1 Tax=Asticcacaulis endophyticus TaxID=1395890 RepID=A0A918UUJ2_9CAUL|nr:hypothetical protein [Asticcacaulis endophyticus]GGZ34056.1 lipoprotein [Asticcacaulis endophyticus]